LPGLVTGLNVACRAVDGDVLTATPVYPPFLSAPRLSGRQLATAALCQATAAGAGISPRWQRALTPGSRLLLLCHPHNPVGRAWERGRTRADRRLLQAPRPDRLLRRNPLPCCSTSTGSTCRWRCSTPTCPAQHHADGAIENLEYSRPRLRFCGHSRRRAAPSFHGAMRGIVPHVNVLGLAATEAAYRDCDDWQQALLGSCAQPRSRRSRLGGHARPAMSHVEATYLAWIDARGLGVADPAAFFEEAGVGLSNGVDFGLPGWVRLNFGCPRRRSMRRSNACGDARGKEVVARLADRIQQRA
jgi:cystathionine beta-lyase